MAAGGSVQQAEFLALQHWHSQSDLLTTTPVVQEKFLMHVGVVRVDDLHRHKASLAPEFPAVASS